MADTKRLREVFARVIEVKIPTCPTGMTEEEHRQQQEAQRDVARERYARFRAENPDIDDSLPF